MKQELVDAIKQLSKDELNEVIELCELRKEEIRNSKSGENRAKAIELGDRVCDMLGTNYLYIARAWQAQDCPYELCSTTDPSDLIERMFDFNEETEEKIQFDVNRYYKKSPREMEIIDVYKEFIHYADELGWTLDDEDGEGYFYDEKISVYLRGGRVFKCVEDSDELANSVTFVE